jgi:hypothetical protein
MEGMAMIDARFVPLTNWPKTETPRHKQRVATFRASYAGTLDLLERELAALYARNITIQAYFRREDIRNDGWPKSSAVPTASGVVLSFDVRSKPAEGEVYPKAVVTELSFPCDTFTTFDDNLRAIALALEALRKIDRYGVTPGHEQYKGWAQLPAASNPANMSCDEAAAFIAQYSGYTIYGVFNDLTGAYRSAAAKLHPDNKQNGSHEQFLRLQRAKEILERI